MKRWLPLLGLLVAVVAYGQPELIHPPGGGAPVEGLPVRVEFGGTGSTESAFTSGECVEVYTDLICRGGQNNAAACTTDSQCPGSGCGLKKLRSAGDACGTGSGGSAIIVDLGDDGGNDTTAMSEIATTGTDTNTIFTVTGTKLSINVDDDWPQCDVADDLVCTNCVAGSDVDESTLAVPFSVLSGGTNTTATMVVDTGATIYAQGSGAIVASDLSCLGCLADSEVLDDSLSASSLAPDSVSASELNATGVEAELEAVLDAHQLQSNCTDAQVLGGTAGGTAVECQADVDTNANTLCTGTTTYLDGEGNCDDISGTYAASGHSHTGSTLSGIDISDDTNLTASGGVTLTGDNLTADLGTSIVTGEITDATITQDDIDDTATLAADPALPVDSVWFGTTGLLFEGNADANETLVKVGVAPAADVTVLLPNYDGALVAADATAPTDDATLVGNGTQYERKALPDSDGAGQVLRYDTTTNAFSAGTLADGDIPNTITIDLATTATTANAGDSATSFFSSGTIEAARLPEADDDETTKGIATYENDDFDVTAGKVDIAPALARDTELVTLKDGGATVGGDCTNALVTNFASTDFAISDGTSQCEIALDANVVKVGGATIANTQIPTIVAVDDTDRCWGNSSDFCIRWVNAGAYATLTGDIRGLTGNVGATGDMIKFGNDTGKLRLSQSATNTVRLSYNTTAAGGRDDTGQVSSALDLSPSTLKWGANGGFGLLNYLTLSTTQLSGLYLVTVTPTLSWGMRGDQARTWGLERHDTANTAGSSLTVLASGATTGATDKAGGDLVLQSGVSTGTGTSTIRLQGRARAVSTGTTDNGVADRFVITGSKALTDGSLTGIVDINIAASQMAGGTIFLTCEATNGTDYQATTTQVSFSGVNKAAAMTCTGTELGADVTASSSGTLTAAVDATTGTAKCTVRVNCDTSLTPSTGYPRVTYQVILNSGFAATVTPL